MTIINDINIAMKVRVKAKENTKCPTERNPREYINDSDIVEIELSTYYKRRIEDGSLIIVKEEEENK